jgi:hypothetical protein
MLRCWGLAVLGIFACASAPAWGQSSNYNKDAVKALSKKIDAHLAKVWQKAKVTPAPKAADHVFFRRLNLDLVGRIPDLSPVTDFMDDGFLDDPLAGSLYTVGGLIATEKRWVWVDRLLDSPEHAKHFSHVWRAIMLGYQTNNQFQFQVPSFEIWLNDRVRSNLPLDKTVYQLLTSQQNVGDPRFGGFQPAMQGQGSPAVFFQANENKAENLAAATSRVFLGVKIECAQCHQHPFAKWKQDQFWEFAAFYSTPQNQIRRPNQPGQPQNFTPGREIPIPGTDKIAKAKFLTGKEPAWDGAKNSRVTLAEWVTSPDNPYFARAMADHLWSHLMGVSLLEPIMEPSDDIPMTLPQLLDDLAKALIDNNFDAKFLIRAIVHTDAYQRSSGGAKLADKEDYHLFVRMPIRALTPEQIYDSVVVATTAPISDKRKELMQPGNPNQFFNPNQLQSPRQQFLQKFTNQDRRHEPQTSILQALFMMNGGFMAERTNAKKNEDLQVLSNPDIEGGHESRIRSMYRMVLSRPPREDEIQRLAPYLERGGATGNLRDAVSDIFWALLNSSEFLHNH